jgi:hypothetical protein
MVIPPRLMARRGLWVGWAVMVAGLVILVFGAREAPAKLTIRNTGVLLPDRSGIEAHNTPSIAVNPLRPGELVVANRVDTPAFACSVVTSSDGGRSWHRLGLPRHPQAPNCYWPQVAFDDEGRLLVLYTTVGGRFTLPVSVWLQRFESLAPVGSPAQVAGPLAFHSTLAAQGRTVVVTWVQAGPATVDKPLGFSPAPNPIMLIRSDDGGVRFGSPVRVSESDLLVALPTVLFGSAGRIVVGALDLGDDLLDYEAHHDGQGGPPHLGRWRVVTWTSEDGGSRFEPASLVTGDLVIPERIIINLGPKPAFTRDPRTSRLFAAWDAGHGDDRQVFLASSENDGRSWSPARPVAPRSGAQSLPAVAVSSGGRVDVVFYDRSRDPDGVLTEVTVASSWDGGRRFSTAMVSPRSFDSRIGFGSFQGIPVLSSQLALVSGRDGLIAFWADTSKGTIEDNRQDVAFAAVGAEAPGRRWGGPVFAGAGMIAAGVILNVRRRQQR